LSHVGAPLTQYQNNSLAQIAAGPDEEFSSAVQALFAEQTLAEIHINPESRVKVTPGSAKHCSYKTVGPYSSFAFITKLVLRHQFGLTVHKTGLFLFVVVASMRQMLPA
jgi:hypothetical protein